jgi:hypothetical protein
MKSAYANPLLVLPLALALMVPFSGSAATKDIVLDRVQASVVTAQAFPQQSDAMAVSVLLESPDGTLNQRSTAATFRTGDRFRVKVVAARDGFIALYNTKPSGETPAQPVWRGPIKTGEELVTPRLRLEGQQGEDLLHVVLEPTAEPAGSWAWLCRALGLDEKGVASKSARKDIVLDVQSTPSTTYVVNPTGYGLTTTLSIRHR